MCINTSAAAKKSGAAPCFDNAAPVGSVFYYTEENGMPAAAQILERTTYTAEEAGAIVPFDRDENVNILLSNILDNNPDMPYDDALNIASQIADIYENNRGTDLSGELSFNERKIVINGREVTVAVYGKIVGGEYIVPDADTINDFFDIEF